MRRDAIFCQALVGALCTLAEQLVWALNLRYSNNGEYEDDCKEVSHKWLEQISAIGVLFNFQSTLSPHMVSQTIHSTPWLCLMCKIFSLFCNSSTPDLLYQLTSKAFNSYDWAFFCKHKNCECLNQVMKKGLMTPRQKSLGKSIQPPN